MHAPSSLSKPELVHVNCDLCSHDDTTLECEAHDTRYHLPGVFKVVRCRNCGLVYVNPRPEGNALLAYYPTTYLQHDTRHLLDNSRWRSTLRHLIFQQNNRHPMRWMVPIYNAIAFRPFISAPHATPQMLDVGCGLGEYALQWQQLGWQVSGLESNQKAATHAQQTLGVPIYIGNLEDTELPQSTFDLITMSHVLEHLTSPTQALKQLHNALKPGGVLIVMVPNYASWDAKFFKEKWQGLEVPRHLYHFEPSPLTRLLHTAGFEKTKISASGHPGILMRNVHAMIGADVSFKKIPALARLVATPIQLLAVPFLKSSYLWAMAKRPIAETSKEP